MKLKDNFKLNQVADVWVVLPLGNATLDFNGMLTLNEPGALLWNALEKGASREELSQIILNEYNVTPEQALIDIDTFLNKLAQAGCMDM